MQYTDDRASRWIDNIALIVGSLFSLLAGSVMAQLVFYEATKR